MHSEKRKQGGPPPRTCVRGAHGKNSHTECPDHRARKQGPASAVYLSPEAVRKKCLALALLLTLTHTLRAAKEDARALVTFWRMTCRLLALSFSGHVAARDETPSPIASLPTEAPLWLAAFISDSDCSTQVASLQRYVTHASFHGWTMCVRVSVNYVRLTPGRAFDPSALGQRK